MSGRIRIGDADRDGLRASMPELLRMRFGVENVNRPFCCPNPAHDDRTPSAKYYADKHQVHCFGCEQTWDVFQLVGLADGLESFPDQARTVADAVGFRLDDEGCGQAARPRVRRLPMARRPLYEAPRPAGGANVIEACFGAYEALFTPEGDIARRYLHWRGLDDGDIVRYGLGFAARPNTVMGEFSWYEPEALGFVVIPFYDEHCTSATYVMARTICRGKANNKEWRPKGLASPLWREWMLANATPVVYVAEGLLDAMALEKQIDKPTMALGGVSYANRLASVLYHTPADVRPGKVMICMDEDDEGRRAAKKIAADLDSIGVPHATLPPYPGGAKDADEWLMARRETDWNYEETSLLNGLTPLRRTRWVSSHAC